MESAYAVNRSSAVPTHPAHCPWMEMLGQRRASIVAALDRYTQQELLPAAPPRLVEAMRYSLLAGGKALRPLLTLEAAAVCAGEVEAALPGACAVEMVHASTLIYDDLPAMDNDDLRRGRPANHKVYGEDGAILSGMALMMRAFELLSRTAWDRRVGPARAARAVAELARAAGAQGLCGGQLLDLAAEGCTPAAAQVEQIHRLKTASLIVAAVRIGAILSGGTEKETEALTRYAEAIGLAFQIQDDVLNVIGDPVQLRKPTGSDQQRSKATYVRLLGLEEAKSQAAAHVEAALAALELFGDEAGTLRALAHAVINQEQEKF